jgi:hypothetical protein
VIRPHADGNSAFEQFLMVMPEIYAAVLKDLVEQQIEIFVFVFLHLVLGFAADRADGLQHCAREFRLMLKFGLFDYDLQRLFFSSNVFGGDAGKDMGEHVIAALLAGAYIESDIKGFIEEICRYVFNDILEFCHCCIGPLLLSVSASLFGCKYSIIISVCK